MLLSDFKILVSQIVIEAVIDASDSFKKKRSDDLRNKLQTLGDELPAVFANQERQEKEINALLASLHDVPEKHVSQRRFRLAAPTAFDEDTGWGHTGSVMDVVAYTHKNSDDYEQVKSFVRTNGEAFKAACVDVTTQLDKIKTKADSMVWPAPWQRYTQWSKVSSEVKRFCDNVKRVDKVRYI